MSKKVTTDDFIKQAKQIHGEKYNYEKTIYVKAKEFLIITCPIHGDFSQRARAHTTNKSGCPSCGAIRANWSKEKFVEEILNRCGVVPYTVIGDYTGTENKILTQNKFGICSSVANNLLKGVIPGIESAMDKNEYWINQAIEIHKDLYDYSKVNYINSEEKVKIICKIHGMFLQTPRVHIQGSGCQKCALSTNGEFKTKKYNEKFNELANVIHNYKYTYLSTTLFKAKDIINIICPKHGNFKQTADHHLRGRGCPSCSLEGTTERMRENPTGWNYTNWEKAGEKSKKFDSFKVYVIKCWNEEEEFYKIGKTFKTISNRFKYKSDLPYEYKSIDEFIFEDARGACELENILKTCNKNNTYIPNKKFCGRYECFKKLDMSCFEEYELEINN